MQPVTTSMQPVTTPELSTSPPPVHAPNTREIDEARARLAELLHTLHTRFDKASFDRYLELRRAGAAK
jgi:hypothetical protein